MLSSLRHIYSTVRAFAKLHKLLLRGKTWNLKKKSPRMIIAQANTKISGRLNMCKPRARGLRFFVSLSFIFPFYFTFHFRSPLPFPFSSSISCFHFPIPFPNYISCFHLLPPLLGVHFLFPLPASIWSPTSALPPALNFYLPFPLPLLALNF